MAQTFDPYRVWLGIPPEERPPNHYRLLGLPLFEDNSDAIAHAADQRMAHLRTVQGGKHANYAANLLNEVARARICLLNPEKKAEYDRQLQKKLTPQPAVVEAGNAPTVTWKGPMELGEYRLLEKLGEGGMGTVYKAVHTRLDRVVAVKLLRRDHLRDEDAVARFDREMKAAGAVDHPNVVRALDAREIDGTRLLAMEYVEGVDLSTLVARAHPISIADACELARQTAQGLDAVHQHGLVHRDVKPSNLMLNRRGQVKLLDLGLARLQRERGGVEVTGTAEALGTVDYMAPEQVGEARSVDIRADIYSLGCTLYKLLTGHPPFGDDPQKSALERAMAHVRDPVPPIRNLRPDVPAELDRVLGRMLAKPPEKRFATPVQAARALAPLTVGHDLPGLLTRAELRPEPPEKPDQAEVPTGKVASSSGLTRFLRGLGRRKPRRGAAPRPAGRRKQRQNLVVGVCAAATALILAVALVVVASRDGPEESAPTGLVIDLPEADRADLALMIDGEQVPVPAEGPVRFRCKPGEVHVYARRPGFKPYDELVTVASDGMTRIAPVLQKQAYLVLHWPRTERSGAKIELDGRPVDASLLARSENPDEIRVPVEPGGHVLWLARRGFAPFEQQLTFKEGESVTIEPQWQAEGEALASAEPPEEGPAAEPPSEPPEEEPAGPEPDPELERQRALEARYAGALKPVEEKVAAWDFAGALKAAEAVKFDEPELTARLAQRREEIGRMSALKERMIARLNEAQPPLQKTDLMLRGFAGEVTGADQLGINTKLATGKTENLPWGDLGKDAPAKLLELVVDRKDPDDWLAAGLVAFVARDTPLAERLLAQARQGGADIGPYLSTLAAGTFHDALNLLDDGAFQSADELLANLDAKYAATPWYTANRQSVAAARKSAKTGIRRTQEAEDLYAEAVRLLHKKELYDVKALVETLKTEYADTQVVTRRGRTPSLVSLERAVADIPGPITVRLDGNGDYTSIQAAIDAAPPQSLIEIGDDGPYREKILIPKDKHELRLRGKKGCWPVITSEGLPSGPLPVVSAEAAGTFLERLALLHYHRGACSLHIRAPYVRTRWLIVHGNEDYAIHAYQRGFECEQCLVTTNPVVEARPAVFRNCLLLGSPEAGRDLLFRASGCEVHFCILLAKTHGTAIGRDSILGGWYKGLVENCAFLAGRVPENARGSFKADPMFVDPDNFDYRLKPGSPCIGRASDGGDIGCRYTPELVELCKKALELRRAGILKF